MPPTVDVNLFVHNGAATVGPAIESVLAQTWPAVTLTLIDDGSTDGTADILARYAAEDPRIRVKRNRANGGAIPNFQRAFWFGDADFVMPKSGDDLISPDFIAETMELLLMHPGTAMAHAAGLIIKGNEVAAAYPPEHNLSATSPDKLERARHVMACYTSSPSFWGVYRRAAADALSPIVYRAGWDHVLLAELALAGEIRHVPAQLYLRRDGGKPVIQLARAATAQGCRGVGLEGELAEQRWRTPLITTAFAHLEMFAASRLAGADRTILMRDAISLFRARWQPFLLREAEHLRDTLPALWKCVREAEPMEAAWLRASLRDAIDAAALLVPEIKMEFAA